MRSTCSYDVPRTACQGSASAASFRSRPSTLHTTGSTGSLYLNSSESTAAINRYKVMLQQSHSKSRDRPPRFSGEPRTYYTTDTGDAVSDATPSICSGHESAPPQNRPPPPPAFSPPPPPSCDTDMAIYNEIELPSYLDLLPDEQDMMSQGRLSPSLRTSFHSSCMSSYVFEDEQDVNVLLTWFKRVSKSGVMSPSLYGLSLEEETRSFNQRAMYVRKALHLFDLLMSKRSEGLQESIIAMNSVSNSVSKVQKKTKSMGIAGSTTGAVGGATAVVGIALAPMTMGISLIATAVGAGMVVAAGGMGGYAAKVNKKMLNRVALKELVDDYKSKVTDIELCLDFILLGMNELQRHDLDRLQMAGAECQALEVAHQSKTVFWRTNGSRNSTAHAVGMSSVLLLQAFSKELDLYFKGKDGKKLRKSCKSRFSGRVQILAENLQGQLDYLNQMWKVMC